MVGQHRFEDARQDDQSTYSLKDEGMVSLDESLQAHEKSPNYTRLRLNATILGALEFRSVQEKDVPKTEAERMKWIAEKNDAIIRQAKIYDAVSRFTVGTVDVLHFRLQRQRDALERQSKTLEQKISSLNLELDGFRKPAVDAGVYERILDAQSDNTENDRSVGYTVYKEWLQQQSGRAASSIGGVRHELASSRQSLAKRQEEEARMRGALNRLYEQVAQYDTQVDALLQQESTGTITPEGVRKLHELDSEREMALRDLDTLNYLLDTKEVDVVRMDDEVFMLEKKRDRAASMRMSLQEALSYTRHELVRFDMLMEAKKDGLGDFHIMQLLDTVYAMGRKQEDVNTTIEKVMEGSQEEMLSRVNRPTFQKSNGRHNLYKMRLDDQRAKRAEMREQREQDRMSKYRR